jgi:polysaccharide transporter, PST family
MNSDDKKRLRSNFISLSILQGLNYILPLITFPYLVATLGIEKFGVLAFATSVIMFFQVLTDYGFNLTATKEISTHRDNVQKLSEIYSAVMTIKLGLIVASFIILCLMVLLLDRFRAEMLTYFYTFGMVIGTFLFPIWFFQGMEKMKYITYLNILAKLFFTICIFVFVSSEDDYYLVPILNSSGFILVGIASIFIIKKQFKIRFSVVGKDVLKIYLIDGWYIFISTVFINIYSNITVLLVGLFTNAYYVGVYSVIEKIVASFNGLFAPVSQTLYPYIAKRVSDDRYSALLFIKRILVYYSISSVALSLVIIVFSYEALYFVTEDEGLALSYMLYLQIASLGIIISRVGDVFGTFSLVAFGFNKEFSRIMFAGAVVSVIISSVFIYLFGFKGSITSYVISTGLVVLALYLKSKSLIKLDNKNG